MFHPLLLREAPRPREATAPTDAIPVDNASAAQYPDVTVRATTSQSGVSEASGHVFVAKTPEAFVHDDDGNLLSDGRWA